MGRGLAVGGPEASALKKEDDIVAGMFDCRPGVPGSSRISRTVTRSLSITGAGGCAKAGVAKLARTQNRAFFMKRSFGCCMK